MKWVMPLTDLAPPHRAIRRPEREWLPTLGWGVMASLSLVIAGTSARYFVPHPPQVAEMLKARLAAHDPWIYLHIGGGVIALAIGPFQFSRLLRLRYLSLHRWVGRVYLIAVAIGAIAGFRMALESFGGLPTHVGFGMLAALWLFTATMAYARILQRRIQSHREWMIRNFALTFAAVMLRLWLPLMAGVMKIDFLPAYQTISWLCWVPNLLLAEVLVNRSKRLPI